MSFDPNFTSTPRVISLASVALSLGLIGCITSPPWEHGDTPIAKQAQMNPCPDGLLDDLEDGDGQIAKLGERGGYWFTYADKFGSTIEPKKFAPEPGGPAGSKLAARMKGKVAENGDFPYVGMGFNFTNPKGLYDASKAAGVRFWAKGPGRVHMELPDANTTPEGDRCSDCYNDFGVFLALEPEWNRYTIPFDRFQQKPGWGDRAPAVAEHELYALEWQFDTYGAEYELWFDNVELVGCDLPEEQP